MCTKSLFFFDNKKDKKRIINLLSDSLRLSGVTVFNSEADADVQIIYVAINQVRTKPTVVVRNDSDFILLFLHKFDLETMKDVIVHSKQRIISIKKLKAYLLDKSANLIDTLLFVHAISGCDTFSSLLGIGKKSIISKVSKLASSTSVFMDRNRDKEQIIIAGEKSMCVLCKTQ